MAAPSQSQIQTYTDQLAAVIAAELAGYANRSTAKTLPSLYNQLTSGAAAGGRDLAAVMSPSFIGVDRFGYPEKYIDQFTKVLGGADLKKLAADLVAYAKTPAGGSYASLAAMLAAESAQIHPLAAELIRANGDPLLSGSTPVGVFAPAYQVKAGDQVLTGADGALVDRTVALAPGGAGAITVFASNGHSLYIRSRAPITRVIAGLATLASASITPTFFYNGPAGYAAIPGLADNSAGFQNNDTIAFAPPADAEPTYLDAAGNAFPNAKEPLFTYQVKRGNAAGITQPVATCLSIVTVPFLNASGRHLPVQQPPFVLLRIPTDNTVVVDPIVGPDIQRWLPPAIRAKALTPFSQTITFLLSYLNQAGVAATQAQGGWASPAALATVAFTLAGTDTGVQGIQSTGWTVSAAGAGAHGVVSVEVVPLRTPAL